MHTRLFIVLFLSLALLCLDFAEFLACSYMLLPSFTYVTVCVEFFVG